MICNHNRDPRFCYKCCVERRLLRNFSRGLASAGMLAEADERAGIEVAHVVLRERASSLVWP